MRPTKMGPRFGLTAGDTSTFIFVLRLVKWTPREPSEWGDVREMMWDAWS